MKKNILISLMACILILMQSDCAYSMRTIPERVTTISVNVPAEEETPEEVDIIKRISLRDKFKRSPEAEINSFFKTYNRYTTKNNIEKLKDLYSDSFMNNDGFDKETVFKLMQMSSDTYKEVKYNTQILNMRIEGNYATVRVHETAMGETAKSLDKVGDTGTIISDVYYTDYLRKEGNKWKILSNIVEYEKVDLKYGEAKNFNVDINAPEYITEGAEYEVAVKTNLPSEIFTVASIVNERITFPQENAKDIFKPLKNDELSRLVKANTNNNNEYATVSLALTRANVEPDTVLLKMTGVAFVMKRVNILHLNKIKLEEEDKNAQK